MGYLFQRNKENSINSMGAFQKQPEGVKKIFTDHVMFVELKYIHNVFSKHVKIKWGAMAHACHCSYLGSIDRRIMVQGQPH
jgi:hypothetical protein